MEKEIIFGNWRAIPQKNGSYLYKAKEDLFVLRKPKPVYKEKPEYPLIEKYETVAKEEYKKELSNTVLKIVEFLKEDVIKVS